MRKDGRETRRNIIEKSLQIFSVKGHYNTSIRGIMAPTGGPACHRERKAGRAAYSRDR